MVFDSERQKEVLMKLVLESKANVTLGEILTGPSDELLALVRAIDEARVIPPEVVNQAWGLGEEVSD